MVVLYKYGGTGDRSMVKYKFKVGDVVRIRSGAHDDGLPTRMIGNCYPVVRRPRYDSLVVQEEEGLTWYVSECYLEPLPGPW